MCPYSIFRCQRESILCVFSGLWTHQMTSRCTADTVLPMYTDSGSSPATSSTGFCHGRQTLCPFHHSITVVLLSDLPSTTASLTSVSSLRVRLRRTFLFTYFGATVRSVLCYSTSLFQFYMSLVKVDTFQCHKLHPVRWDFLWTVDIFSEVFKQYLPYCFLYTNSYFLCFVWNQFSLDHDWSFSWFWRWSLVEHESQTASHLSIHLSHYWVLNIDIS